MVTRVSRVRIRNTAWISRCKSRCKIVSGKSIRRNQTKPESWDIVSDHRQWTIDHYVHRLWSVVYELTSSSFCNRHELVRLEACAANQRPIDIRISKELGSIRGGHGPAVQD